MKFILSCAMVSLSWCFLAQNCAYTIKGTVRDKHTLEVIPFAKILVVELDKNILTDSVGNFLLFNLCAGNLTLKCIPHLGCEPVVVSVLIPRSEPINFFVESHSLELDEFVLEAFRFRRESQAGMTLPTNDLSILKGNTLGEQLSRVPGVTTMNTGSSIVKPIINGMHSNRLVIVNNGIRQEGQQWGSEHAPEIDPNLAENLEVIQGAAGLQYGPDAIGGVIIVSPEALQFDKKLHGWAKLGGNTNGKGAFSSLLLAGSAGKSKKFAYRFHGTTKTNGTQNTPDYLLKNTALNEISYSGALGYQLKRLELDVFYSRFTTNLGIFTGSHIGNLTDLNTAFTAEKPAAVGIFTYQLENPKQHIDHHLSRVQLVFKWNKKVQTTAVYGYQYNLRQEYDLHKSYASTPESLKLPAFELNLWTNTFDLKTEIKHSKKWLSNFGLSAMQQSNAYSGRFFIPNFKKSQIGMYYIGEIEREEWAFDYGVRFDLSALEVFIYEQDSLIRPTNQFAHASYSFGVSKFIGHHFLTRFNFGSAWRPPSINELYSNGLHHGAAAIEIGDRKMNKEIVYNAQLGIEYKSNIAKLNLSVFYNYFDGYINLQPSFPPVLTIVGAFPVFNYRQSNVQLFGLNGQMDIPITKFFTYTLQGSVLFADDLTYKKPVFGIPANRITQRLRFTLPIKKTAWKTFVELEGLNVSKQKRMDNEDDYVPVPEGYFLLNGQVGISKKMKGEQTMQLVVACQNSTNTRYRDYMNRFRYFADDLGRNWTVKLLLPIQSNKLK